MSEPQGPRPIRYELHLADLSSGVLTECADFTIEVLPPQGAAPSWQPTDDVVSDIAKSIPEATRISRPCAQQFADRTSLASCTSPHSNQQKDGSTRSMTMVQSYFDYGSVGLDDELMNECLKEYHGDWQAIPRTSSKWTSAKLEYNQRQRNKVLKKLENSR